MIFFLNRTNIFSKDQKKWTKSTSFCVRRRIQTVFFLPLRWSAHFFLKWTPNPPQKNHGRRVEKLWNDPLDYSRRRSQLMQNYVFELGPLLPLLLVLNSLGSEPFRLVLVWESDFRKHVIWVTLVLCAGASPRGGQTTTTAAVWWKLNLGASRLNDVSTTDRILPN